MIFVHMEEPLYGVNTCESDLQIKFWTKIHDEQQVAATFNKIVSDMHYKSDIYCQIQIAH